jgi:hypothetical protein
LSLRGVVSPSPLIHGGVRLDRVRGHARAPAKSRMSGVYDSGRVSYLLCDLKILHLLLWRRDTSWRARRSLSKDSVCHHTDFSTPTAVLWLGVASLDSLGDPAYGGLRDPV